jgi:hypothetical protein
MADIVRKLTGGRAAQPSYDRLSSYATDFSRRIQEQREWWSRHPEYGPSDEIPDEVLEADPFPSTSDVITSERFLDLLIVALQAFEEARRD